MGEALLPAPLHVYLQAPQQAHQQAVQPAHLAGPPPGSPLDLVIERYQQHPNYYDSDWFRAISGMSTKAHSQLCWRCGARAHGLWQNCNQACFFCKLNAHRGQVNSRKTHLSERVLTFQICNMIWAPPGWLSRYAGMHCQVLPDNMRIKPKQGDQTDRLEERGLITITELPVQGNAFAQAFTWVQPPVYPQVE
jgi:hypothetical protein